MIWILYGALIAVGIGVLAFVINLHINVWRVKAKLKKENGEKVVGYKANDVDVPKQVKSDEINNQYIATLQDMIRCKTVFVNNDKAEYLKFNEVLKKAFPLLHAKAEMKCFGSGCLFYKINGSNAKKNILLMSHHDVVNATGEWKYPAFDGVIADGALWGRGAVDTKTPLFGELQAVEELLAEGYEFDNINVYIGSSNNEEVCGDGMPIAVEYFKENGIHFDIVVDEGGAITTGMMPGVVQKSAMVAVHEKGRHTYVCTAVNTQKGHLGLNPNKNKTNTVQRMSEFIAEVNGGKNLFKTSFHPEVQATFETHAPYMTYPYCLLFANFKCFRGILLKLLPKINTQVGSMLSTTMQFTTINSDNAAQVMSKEVKATAFFRCVRENVLKEDLIKFKKIADKYNIVVEESIADYCKPTAFDSAEYATLKKSINTVFPDVIVSPFLLTAGTDARHFTQIADSIFRFAPIDLSIEQYNSVHNPNENISLSNIPKCVKFYKTFIKNISEHFN